MIVSGPDVNEIMHAMAIQPAETILAGKRRVPHSSEWGSGKREGACPGQSAAMHILIRPKPVLGSRHGLACPGLQRPTPRMTGELFLGAVKRVPYSRPVSARPSHSRHSPSVRLLAKHCKPTA